MYHVVIQHCGFAILVALLTDFSTSFFVLISGSYPQVVHFLIKREFCNAEAKDKDGQTLLHHAVRYTQYLCSVLVPKKLFFVHVKKLGDIFVLFMQDSTLSH